MATEAALTFSNDGASGPVEAAGGQSQSQASA